MRILIHPFARRLRNGNENPKNYPYWGDLVARLRASEHKITQIGNYQDRRLVEDFVMDATYDQMVELVLLCDLWIGIDSFLQHLGWYLEKPGIVLWGKSDPVIFGHPENVNLLGSRKNLRRFPFEQWEAESYDPDVFVSPDKIIETLKERFQC